MTGAINAAVQAGFAYPALFYNNTVEIPAIILYGTTYDEVSYLIQISGTGKPTGQRAKEVSLYHSWKLRFDILRSEADAKSPSSKSTLVESTQP